MGSLRFLLHAASNVAANVRRRRLPVLKDGFCVSTVSIVCGRATGSMAVVAGCTYWTGRRLARPRVVIVIADDADGADGIFCPPWFQLGLAFIAKGNPNIPYSKERLRTTQAGPATARGFFGQPLGPPEAAANSSAGLPFDGSQLTFFSMSSRAYVAPARARAASKA
jgi:hypothetical protein